MLPFYDWVIFHCTYVPQLLYPFICRWTSRLLPCPNYCNSAAMNIRVHMSFSIIVFSGYMASRGIIGSSVQFSSVQSLSRVRLFTTPWTAARQASLTITNSRSLLTLMSFKSVMPSSHLILCRPLLLLPPIPPSIRVFSSESALHMRCPKYWSWFYS